ALVAREGDLAQPRQRGPGGQVKAVNGVEKEQGADALVKVVRLAAEALQVGALGQQVLQRGGPAPGVQRLVTHGGVAGGDNGSESSAHNRWLGGWVVGLVE